MMLAYIDNFRMLGIARAAVDPVCVSDRKPRRRGSVPVH